MIDALLSFVTGVVSGVVASILVLLFVHNIKPRIQVNNKILRQDLKAKRIYGLKLNNFGRTRAYDLKVMFWWVDYTFVKGKKMPVYKKMEMGNSHLNERPFLEARKKDNTDGEMIFTLVDLEKFWEEGHDLQVIITSRHAITQTLSTTECLFTKSSICDELFYSDNVLDECEQ
jgi:hypothetical protein